MTATTDSVQRLYIAYFNRPADPIGLQYWVNQIGAGQSVESVANNLHAKLNIHPIILA